jgi:pyrroline-5-carboxylate reductase
MPNTPAAIGRGITALIGNGVSTEAQMALAEGLLSAVGQTVRLDDEAQMDAVTGVSGSGPAYVFHLIEALAAAGEAEGLARELAMKLATATVAGAGALAEATGETPRSCAVTSRARTGRRRRGSRC